MKFGQMKYDVPFESFNKDKCDFTKFEYWRIKNEGKRLYKKHPEYEYLKEDPFLNDPHNEGVGFNEDEFYYSIVYTYIIDCLLKQHPELGNEYKKQIQKSINIWNKITIRGPIKDNINKIYSCYNRDFLDWYQNYLRDKANPGIVERERQESARAYKAAQIAHDMHKMQAKIQEEQDLTAGTRVVCPYCKSADTKKLTALNRAVSVSLVGAASGKIGKQWHCNHCNSDF